MLPDRVSNPGPLIYESSALPIALRGPAYNRGSPEMSMLTCQLKNATELSQQLGSASVQGLKCDLNDKHFSCYLTRHK